MATSGRIKKIKILLSMMKKQSQRFIPITPHLTEMMDMTATDEELNYLLPMGTDFYDYDHAVKNSGMTEDRFRPFFKTMRRKGLVHVEYDGSGNEKCDSNNCSVRTLTCSLSWSFSAFNRSSADFNRSKTRTFASTSSSANGLTI